MQQNSNPHKLDEQEFKLEIQPNLNKGKQLNIFCSFTYITPNYSILFTLNELKNFISSGDYNVFLTIWDMNTLANPYFKRMCSSRKIGSPEGFIQEKLSELKDLAIAVGFDKEKLSIYKSSDLWKRLISYNEEDIFQDFYSILAQMKPKNFISQEKSSHLFQIPLDMFFCNYFHKLYPEDTNQPMDLVFFGNDKEDLYISTRDFMIKDGLIDNKRPLLILMKKIPYLLYNHSLPEWNMSLKAISTIITNVDLSRREIFDLFRHLCINERKIIVDSNNNKEEISYKEFSEKFEKASEEKLRDILSENLFNYLKEHKKRYLEHSGKIEESVLEFTKKRDVKNIGQVSKSDIALEILIRADGLRNTTQISKEIKKSIATISTYATRLKKMGLIRVLPDGTLKRNIKGLKVNFELGL